MAPYITNTNEDELRAELKNLDDNLIVFKGIVTEGQLRAWRRRRDIVKRGIANLYKQGYTDKYSQEGCK